MPAFDRRVDFLERRHFSRPKIALSLIGEHPASIYKRCVNSSFGRFIIVDWFGGGLSFAPGGGRARRGRVVMPLRLWAPVGLPSGARVLRGGGVASGGFRHQGAPG